MHGLVDRYFLLNNLATNFLSLGNQIASPHALLVVAHGLQHFSEDLDVETIFRAFHEARLQPHQVELIQVPGVICLLRRAPNSQMDSWSS